MTSHIQTNNRKKHARGDGIHKILHAIRVSSVSLGLMILIREITSKAFHWYFTKTLPVF